MPSGDFDAIGIARAGTVVRQVAPPSDASTEPARIGAAIGTLAELRRHGSGPTGLGRLGGVVVRRSARDLSEPLGLTCHHVLSAGGVGSGAPVFQPRIGVGPEGLTVVPGSPIGSIACPGAAEPHDFAYPGEDPRSYYVDCASVRLSVPYRAPAPVRAARVHSLDIAPPRRLRVRLLGLHPQARGEIVDVAATVPREDGRRCENTIVIETLPGLPPFAGPGESGALVVDMQGRAVGLLWGVDLRRPTRAFACHLLPALDRLGLVLVRATRRGEGPA